MRLHSDKLTYGSIQTALGAAQDKGLVARHVYFHIIEERGSRSRKKAFEVQLGTDVKVKGDKRGFKNSGTHGAGNVYAATYDEWGWFIAELFDIDPDLSFGHYKSLDGFHKATGFAFA